MSWEGVFEPNGGGWEINGIVTVDLEKATLGYRPVVGMGSFKTAPKDYQEEWTIPFSAIEKFEQEDVKFGRIKAGYRSIGAQSIGAVINGQRKLPLPFRIGWVGLAYAEEAVRQAVREYGTQVARLANVPASRAKLVSEKSGGGLFSFMQLWTAGAMAFSEATGNTSMTSFWSQQLATANADAASQRQLAAQGSAAWDEATRDPLLMQVLSVDVLSADIDRLLR